VLLRQSDLPARGLREPFFVDVNPSHGPCIARGEANPSARLGSRMQTRNLSRSPIPLARVFPVEAISVGLESRTPEGVVAELIHRLVALRHIATEEEENLVADIMAREKVGSTAIGNEIAMPHCRSRLAERFVGALGIEPRGVAFDSVDGAAVHVVFLVVAPPKGHEHYYDILGRINAIGRNKTHRLHLRACRTPEIAHRFLEELDSP
jgi:mannitol/fructose-specific phosphotransferase system IIA component (Ntr-type)